MPDSPLTLPPNKAIAWYDGHAKRLASQYEALAAGDVHAWLTNLLPVAPGFILDIDAGTGRDAVWLAAQGHEVLAIEPSSSMRQQGQQLHADTRIRWLEDRLPAIGGALGMPDLDEIHAAIGLQRLRLHQDQQVPEWNG